jgi:acyl-CoA dehydrogenase
VDFEHSEKVLGLRGRLEDFMAQHIYPNEPAFFAQTDEVGPWGVQPIMETLKDLARGTELWNLFLGPDHGGLTNLRRSARSWGDRTWRPRCSTARPPTWATWRS